MKLAPESVLASATVFWTLVLAMGPGGALAQDELGAARAYIDSTAIPPDTSAVPQKDVGDVIAGILGRERKFELGERIGLNKTILPAIGYNPAYGAYFGVSVALGGWLGTPKTTQLSAGSVSGTYSTSGQISVQFKSDFYTPDNRWVLRGDWRYLDTAQSTWGLGPATSFQSEYPMEFKLYRLYQTIYRRVGSSSTYVGAGYHFDRHDEIFDERATAGEPTPFVEYSGGSATRTQSSGFSLAVITDTRDNPINASRGLFWSASMRFLPKAFGSDVTHQMLFSDFRGFLAFPKDGPHTLAVWNILWFSLGEVPYLGLPAIGWDTYGRSGRGFIQGRVRGPSQTYTELEYRRRLSRDGLWGMVGFVNLSTTSAAPGEDFGSPDFGGGAGVRLKFNKRTNTNLAVDAGYGQDESVRLFFGLQEVF
jgi:hypothetical protein